MPASSSASSSTDTFAEFAEHVDYSLLNQLRADPEASVNGHDHQARQVKSGHYVPVTPTPLPAPQYVAHSKRISQSLVEARVVIIETSRTTFSTRKKEARLTSKERCCFSFVSSNKYRDTKADILPENNHNFFRSSFCSRFEEEDLL